MVSRESVKREKPHVNVHQLELGCEPIITSPPMCRGSSGSPRGTPVVLLYVCTVGLACCLACDHTDPRPTVLSISWSAWSAWTNTLTRESAVEDISASPAGWGRTPWINKPAWWLKYTLMVLLRAPVVLLCLTQSTWGDFLAGVKGKFGPSNLNRLNVGLYN